MVEELLERMRVKARITPRYVEPEDERDRRVILVDIQGNDLSILIGRRSETLERAAIHHQPNRQQGTEQVGTLDDRCAGLPRATKPATTPIGTQDGRTGDSIRTKASA